jgi:hypothetical protein
MTAKWERVFNYVAIALWIVFILSMLFGPRLNIEEIVGETPVTLPR